MKFSCYVLIVAAGSGYRFDSHYPKQYAMLLGEPVLRRTVKIFLEHSEVDRVYVVYDPDHARFFNTAIAGLDVPKPISGGSTRQESCRLGLEHLAQLPEPPQIVLIHDAARPLVDGTTISRVIHELRQSSAVITALPVVDTLKQSTDNDHILRTVDRTNLWQAQTPQGFDFQTLLQAHQQCQGMTLTDDAAVVEQLGIPVSLVPGDRDNIKITSQNDLTLAQKILSLSSPQEIRTAFGFDVHRLDYGDGLILCGVEVICDRCLVGHSDGDVGFHALTDALLGTIGAGDIGEYFPPTNPRWKGAESKIFVAHAVNLLRQQGGQICHVDVTFLCETPKIAPYRAAMRESIATLLEVKVECTSVKATTMEKLGFIGREEGIAAQAVATVSLPLKRS